MPFFEYEANDPQGQPTRGRLELPTLDAATRALTGAGYSAVRLVPVGGGGGSIFPSSGPGPGMGSGPGPGGGAAAIAMPLSTPIVTPVAIPGPVAVGARANEERPAYRPRSKRTFFLWEQMARFFAVGVATVTSLDTLSNRPPSAAYGKVLAKVRDRVAGGASLADAMAEHPGPFSPDEVGTIRAGERGGFLPEAMMACAAACDHARRIRLRAWYPLAMILLTAASTPFIHTAVLASIDALRRQDKAGGQLPRWGTYASSYEKIIPGTLAAALPWAILFVAVIAIWMSPWLRILRHRLSLHVPIIGKRTWAESMERLGFLSARLAASGIPVREAFTLAAAGMPNLWLRRQMMETAAAVNEGEPFSRAFSRVEGMDGMTLNALQNAEMTGDVPGALYSVASAQREDFDRTDAASFFFLALTFTIMAGLAVFGLLVWLYPMLYQGIQTVMTEDPG